MSSHQDWIDWDQVAAAGVDFAMIRAGYRGYTTGRINQDPYRTPIGNITLEVRWLRAGCRRLFLFPGHQRVRGSGGSTLGAEADRRM